MANKIVKTRIQNKHDLEVNWNNATNFIPLAGELIIYDKEVDANGEVLKDANGSAKLPSGRSTPYSYERFKLGDGVTVISALPFVGLDKSRLDDLALIDINDIDTICEGTIQYAEDVMF